MEYRTPNLPLLTSGILLVLASLMVIACTFGHDASYLPIVHYGLATMFIGIAVTIKATF